MIPAAKIDAALAAIAEADADAKLCATRSLSPYYTNRWSTGLTVADLRELLEAAQWRDPSEPPTHSGPVQIETRDGLGVARYAGGPWDGIDAPLLREDVLRWRELPR